MSKETIDKMAQRFQDDLIRLGHSVTESVYLARNLRTQIYRTYGIKEEAPDARN